jgi:hypothetical protein
MTDERASYSITNLRMLRSLWLFEIGAAARHFGCAVHTIQHIRRVYEMIAQMQ